MQYVKWQSISGGDIGLFRITVSTGIREQGRLVDHRKRGRQASGLLLLQEGEVSFHQENGETLRITDHTVCLLPQGERYQLRFDSQHSRIIVINFILTDIKGNDVIPAERITVLLKNAGDSAVPHLFEKIARQAASQEPVAMLRSKELLYRLLTLLLEEKGAAVSQNPKYSGILPGVQLLQRTYLENLPIAAYAAACNVSVSSFRALFTELYGVPPLRYRNQLRIKHARVLLAENCCTVSEAARESGFENVGYFCRLYKKLTGQTPGLTQAQYSE